MAGLFHRASTLARAALFLTLGSVTLGSVTLGSVTLGSSTARADCAASEPSVGVTLRECADVGRRWAELRADLAAADLAVRVTRQDEGGAALDAWAASVGGVIAALPGGDYDFPALSPRGLTIAEGAPWTDAHDDARRAVLALDARGVGLVAPALELVPVEAWMANAVSGPQVLRAGTVPAACEADGCERRPRTAVGLSADGRFLVAVAAAGWVADAVGVTAPELGELARDAGAHDALEAGTGAASGVWVEGRGAVVASSDGAFRPGAAHLGLVARGDGATQRIRGVVEQAAEPNGALPDARIRIEALDGTLVLEGGTLTSMAFWEHTVPQREYFVRASHPGYVTGCKYCPSAGGEDVWCSLFLAAGEGEEVCTAPPRGVDAGPWPEGDPSVPDPDAGATPDGGRAPVGGSSGCAVAAGPAGGSRGLPALALLGALIFVAKRRSL